MCVCVCCISVCCSVLQCVTVLQYFTVSYSVLQCVAAICSVLQCVDYRLPITNSKFRHFSKRRDLQVFQGSVLQQRVLQCVLHRVATRSHEYYHQLDISPFSKMAGLESGSGDGNGNTSSNVSILSSMPVYVYTRTWTYTHTHTHTRAHAHMHVCTK